MVTKQGKQASRKAAARKYGFLEVPLRDLTLNATPYPRWTEAATIRFMSDVWLYVQVQRNDIRDDLYHLNNVSHVQFPTIHQH